MLRATVLPKLGHLRLSSVTRNVLQDLVERMVADGLSPSTVRNTILPLRAIYRRALQRSEVLVNPTLGLPLPASRKRRERIARPAEARALTEALPQRDRALWATAFYAGLRRQTPRSRPAARRVQAEQREAELDACGVRKLDRLHAATLYS